MNNIFINKKVWENFTDEEMDEYVHSVFKHYRATGFPLFSEDAIYREKEWSKLQKYDYRNCVDSENKIIKQTMHGLSLAWSYMPHSWRVVCNDKMTPWELFNDDELLLKCIRKRITMGDNMSDSGMRKMMKIFTGTQSVSNFRPTAAAAIYSAFTQKGDRVWDMSSGFGGRLLGASYKRLGINYIGTDPSTPTFNGLWQMNKDFNINAVLHNCGSEVFIPDRHSLDFCFTSPPYFNLEKYTYEETQSWVKFSDKDAWVNMFLKRTMENCYHGLKPNKFMAINVANTRNFKDFEEQTIRIAKEVGFYHSDTWKLALSNPSMSAGKSKFKYEPIFIFSK